MREEIMAVKKEIEEIKEESLASQILSYYKKQNKRLFIIWVITFLALMSLTCYTIYLLNDIGTIETTVTQENAENNNYIGNDGTIINGETDGKNN